MSESEHAAIDFSKELKSLADVHEIRGCPTGKMARVMVYAGLAQLGKTSRNRAEVALKVMEVIEQWKDYDDD